MKGDVPEFVKVLHADTGQFAKIDQAKISDDRRPENREPQKEFTLR